MKIIYNYLDGIGVDELFIAQIRGLLEMTDKLSNHLTEYQGILDQNNLCNCGSMPLKYES